MSEATEVAAAGQTSHVVDRNVPPLVEAEGVWKIFGPGGDRIIGTPDADL